jgi:hypothetical protein
VSEGAEPARPPQSAALMSFSTATTFAFEPSEARLDR